MISFGVQLTQNPSQNQKLELGSYTNTNRFLVGTLSHFVEYLCSKKKFLVIAPGSVCSCLNLDSAISQNGKNNGLQ